MWQKHNIRPTVWLGMGTADEPFSHGERAFCVASDLVALEEGDRAIVAADFSNKEGD